MRDRYIVLVFTVALGVFGGVALAARHQFQRYDLEIGEIFRTQRVIGSLDRAMATLRQAESAERGYLLTGDPALLKPYHHAVDEIGDRLDTVASSIRNHPAQRERMRVFRERVEERFQAMGVSIAERERGASPRTRDPERYRAEQAQTLAIRGVVLEMADDEATELASKVERAEAASFRTGSLLLFGNGTAFALLCTGTLLLAREVHRRKVRDVRTELKREKDLLSIRAEAVEHRLESVLEEMPVSVALIDWVSGRVVFRNEKAAEFFGDYLPVGEDVRNAKIRPVRVDGTPYPSGEDPLSRTLRSGDEIRGEIVQMIRHNGSPGLVVLHAARVRTSDGCPNGVVAAFDDYTDLYRAEEDRERRDRFGELFLRAVGHDLRNPLGVITAGTRALEDRGLDPVSVKVNARMKSSAERMSRMVDQLIALVECHLSGSLSIDRRWANLATVARDAAARMEVAYPDRVLEVEMSGSLGGVWDVHRIEQVVIELLANAFEYGDPQEPVRLALRGVDEREVSIQVHNRGEVIPEEAIPLAFDPFRRASERKRLRTSGFGIGLFLALQVTRLHGGTVSATSSKEEGTTFTVSLPRGTA